MISRSAVCPSYVGRDAELGVVDETLTSVAAEGGGRLVLVTGPAGVGKTRMVRESAQLAAQRGLAVLEGQCSAESAIPFACFVTAIRRRTRLLGEAELTALFAGSAALAAVLLPEVARTIDLPSGQPSPEDLFAAVWQLLARLVRPAGGLLLLEDLHWADLDSLQMLTYLARELDDLPLCVIATYRADELHRRHPLRLALSELARERRYDELVLDPLAREQVRLMLSAILDGTEVGDEFADAVLERTGGNPFFVEELTKVLLERGDIYQEDGDWERRDLIEIELPLSVRETLLARARSLDATTFDILKLAALGGVVLDSTVLAAAADVDEGAVETAIDAGLRLQILAEEREAAGPAYSFRHALSREAFADELVGPDRRRAHGRLAEALVVRHADEPDAFAAAIADHFAAAGDNEHAFEYARSAARAAAASYAVDEADRRYDQALQQLSAADDRRLPLLLEAAVDAAPTQLSPMQVAFTLEARRLAAEAGDPIVEARACATLAAARWEAGDGPGSIALSTEARELLRGRDDFEEAWVVRRLARMLALGDRPADALALVVEGVDLAERSGNSGALSGLYGTRMIVEPWGPGFDEAYAASLAAARASDDLDAEANVSTNAGSVALWCGHHDEARQSLRRAIEIHERTSPHERYPAAMYAWLLSLTGEYDAVDTFAQPLRRSTLVPGRVVALTAMCEVAHRRGDANTAELVDELVELATSMGENQRSVPALSARARQVLAVDGIDAAAPVFGEVMTATLRPHLGGSHWLFSPDFAAALATESRVGELEEWTAQVRQINMLDANDANIAAGRLCAGYLHMARDEPQPARTAFDDALARYRAMPCPAREVETLLGLAELDRRAGNLSTEAVDEALRVATVIDARVLQEQARRAAALARSHSVLATVLFTDIIGSTETAARVGDSAWRQVIERHHLVVRRELARAGGRELDTAGDGFLASFTSPAQAIRGACSIRDALSAVGIGIRAGLHTGECQEVDGKLTGLAVHIASRVSSAAGDGEVFASGTVKELVAGSGIAFEPRGTRELRGVPGEWSLYAVTGLEPAP